MKRFHYEKADSGITLTVLVITVIVLIILAGTSINMLSGEQGILKQAEEIVDVSAKKTIEEEIQLAISEAKMEYTGLDLVK